MTELQFGGIRLRRLYGQQLAGVQRAEHDPNPTETVRGVFHKVVVNMFELERKKWAAKQRHAHALLLRFEAFSALHAQGIEDRRQRKSKNNPEVVPVYTYDQPVGEVVGWIPTMDEMYKLAHQVYKLQRPLGQAPLPVEKVPGVRLELCTDLFQ